MILASCPSAFCSYKTKVNAMTLSHSKCTLTFRFSAQATIVTVKINNQLNNGIYMYMRVNMFNLAATLICLIHVVFQNCFSRSYGNINSIKDISMIKLAIINSEVYLVLPSHAVSVVGRQ